MLAATKCTNCGANINADPALSVNVCPFCGTVFMIRRPQPASNNFAVNSQSNQSNNTTEALNFYYPATMSLKAFEREVFTSLAKNPQTPRDILEARFADTKRIMQEFWLVEQDLTVNWTASIGYNRTEKYVEHVEKTEYIDGQPQTRTVREQKTRIVTDWSPLSGKANYHVSFFLNVNGNDINDFRDIKFLIDNKTEPAPLTEDIITEINVDVHRKPQKTEQETINRKNNEEVTKRWNIDAPGDTKKDFSFTTDCTNMKIARFYIPAYALEYTYGGSPYFAFSNAVKPDFRQNFPKENESAKYAKEQTKKLKLSTFAAAALAIICGVIYAAVQEGPPFAIILSLTAMSACFVTAGVLGCLWYLKSKKSKVGILQTIEKEKLIALESFLSSHGL